MNERGLDLRAVTTIHAQNAARRFLALSKSSHHSYLGASIGQNSGGATTLQTPTEPPLAKARIVPARMGEIRYKRRVAYPFTAR